MEDMSPIEGEIDWLTGGYTYKREKLKRDLRRLDDGFAP